jgi:CheY-like chemotaxis protein
MTRHVLSAVPDLYMSAKIREAAEAAGVSIETCDLGKAFAAAKARRPDLVVLDLQADGDPLALVSRLRDEGGLGRAEIVGFYRHVDTATRDAARTAGLDHVLPRSEFVRRLPALLGQAPRST